MKISRVLIVYKTSAYEIYVLRRHGSLFRPGKGPQDAVYLRRYRRSHNEHARTLKEVKKVLRKYGIRYDSVQRTEPAVYSHYDLIVSVGGDGTFLDAARHVGDQPILGVNSDPRHSIGHFCAVHRCGFGPLVAKLLNGRARHRLLNRMRLKLNGRVLAAPALNDVLVCHSNPAAMSRYRLSAGPAREEQRSSGVWISTAAGSTGAIHSAGARTLPLSSRRLQYRPRELYAVRGERYRLTGGRVRSSGRISVHSLMREGVFFVDGPHMRVPFRYGDTLEIRASGRPLKVIAA